MPSSLSTVFWHSKATRPRLLAAASSELALNTTYVIVEARVGSGNGCSHHNSDTEYPSLVVYLEQEPEVSPAALRKCTWES